MHKSKQYDKLLHKLRTSSSTSRSSSSSSSSASASASASTGGGGTSSSRRHSDDSAAPRRVAPFPAGSVCCLCARESSASNRLLRCAGCGVSVHQQCYGIDAADAALRDWRCALCRRLAAEHEAQGGGGGAGSSSPISSIDCRRKANEAMCQLCSSNKSSLVEQPPSGATATTATAAAAAAATSRRRLVSLMGQPPTDVFTCTTDGRYLHTSCAMWQPQLRVRAKLR